VSFTLATSLALRVGKWTDPTRSDGVFKKLLGDGRKLFANQFIEMADVYLHSGYYPSIFDRRDPKARKAITATTDEGDHEGHEHDADGNCKQGDDDHEKEMNFLGQPSNWLESFIRQFRITQHTHLEHGEEREVLPWLKVAIELDPQKIDTYVSTAFWLRKELGKVKDAEAVLREGIRNNPNSSEILFEMGLLYDENYKEPARARNIWVLALRRWNAQTEEAKAASTDVLGRIAIHLARLEEAAGNLPQAIQYFEVVKQVSPSPGPLQKRIDELKGRVGGPTTPALPPLP
jgi:tetratricopeptide (TPR) repeat protein